MSHKLEPGGVGPPRDDASRASELGPALAEVFTNTNTPDATALGRQDRASAAVSSQQVNWWSVHEFVSPLLDRTRSWPMAGTPKWRALDADDPVKLAALLDAAQHWALRLETCQQAECEASRAISAAADWATISRHIRDEAQFDAERPWLKRVAS